MTVPAAVSAIPEELRALDQWVVWRWEVRDGKRTKPPYQPNGQHASSTQPATWTTFDEALAALQRGGFDGPGFVLTGGDPFTAVDLDHCVAPNTGQARPWAQWIVDTLQSYAETTPSGEGLRVIVKARLPPGGRKRGNVEMYDAARYITVTGNHCMGTPRAIEGRQAEVEALHAEVFGLAQSSAPVSLPAIRAHVLDDDRSLIAHAMAAGNGGHFQRLWQGDTAGHPSPSESDLALCNHLAFHTGGDGARMDRLFRASGLMRPKWDERHFADGATYGEATLAKALRSTSANPATPSWPQPLDADAFHGLAGGVVTAIRPHTEADDGALLTSFLVAFGNAVGRGPYAVAEADRHACNLFAVLVGETAKARKGSSWGHIRHLLSLAEAAWGAGHVAQGLSSGEGLIYAVRDPMKLPAVVKDKGRPTGGSETVTEDYGVDDKRLLVLESEFASPLRIMERPGNTLSPTLRQSWDTGDLRTLTKNSPTKATGAHISVLGHVTRGELLRYLNDTEAGNGFANRFLWVCTRRAKVLLDGGGAANYGRLVECLRTALEHGRRLGQLARDPLARQLWAEVYPELSEGKPGLFGAVTARAEAQVLRLSLLYAVLDGVDAIGPPHLKAALAVWEYSEASARYIFGDATGEPVADQILRALRATGELTRTAISALFNRNVAAARIEHALRSLGAAGLARCELRPPPDGSGRPSEVWRA